MYDSFKYGDMKIYSKSDLPFINNETIKEYNSIILDHNNAKNNLNNIKNKIDNFNSKKSNIHNIIIMIITIAFIGVCICSLIISGSLLWPVVIFVVSIAIIGNSRINSGDRYEKGKYGLEYIDAKNTESRLQFELWNYHDIFAKTRIAQINKDKFKSNIELKKNKMKLVNMHNIG